VLPFDTAGGTGTGKGLGLALVLLGLGLGAGLGAGLGGGLTPGAAVGAASQTRPHIQWQSKIRLSQTVSGEVNKNIAGWCNQLHAVEDFIGCKFLLAF
jgi:hypothetical protein